MNQPSIDAQPNRSIHETHSRAARPARVLFVSHWSTAHGGSSIALLDIITHLDRARFQPVALCPEPGELPDRLDELGVPVVLHRNTRLKRDRLIAFARDVAWYRRWLRREAFDLIHVHSGGWRPSLVLAARLAKIPFVKHVQNPVSHTRRDFVYRWARRIITCSDAVGQPLRDDPWFGHKTQTIHNAVDLAPYENATGNRREEISAGDRPIVGFVGQLVPRKGLLTLINAMPEVLRTCPEALLVAVGCSPPGEQDYEDECRGLVKQLGLESHVIFTGYRRDIPDWMRTFDVFVLPTRSEAFGIVNIEAMAAGCPIVASAVGGIPEIISRPELGTLIPPDDPQATARAILAYLTDRERSAEVGRAAAAHVRDHFTTTSMIRRVESLYCDVLAASRQN